MCRKSDPESSSCRWHVRTDLRCRHWSIPISTKPFRRQWSADCELERRPAQHRSQPIHAAAYCTLGSRIEDVETSIWPGGHLLGVRCIRALWIGDELGSNIVRRTTLVGKVQLPQVLEAWRFFDDVPS